MPRVFVINTVPLLNDNIDFGLIKSNSPQRIAASLASYGAIAIQFKKKNYLRNTRNDAKKIEDSCVFITFVFSVCSVGRKFFFFKDIAFENKGKEFRHELHKSLRIHENLYSFVVNSFSWCL